MCFDQKQDEYENPSDDSIIWDTVADIIDTKVKEMEDLVDEVIHENRKNKGRCADTIEQILYSLRSEEKFGTQLSGYIKQYYLRPSQKEFQKNDKKGE
jgi:hypothetical protein